MVTWIILIVLTALAILTEIDIRQTTTRAV